MLLDQQSLGCEFHPSTDRIFSCPSTSSSHTSPPICDGDLEFSEGENSLAMACQSAKDSGGTYGAHTHRLRFLVLAQLQELACTGSQWLPSAQAP